MLNCIPAKIQYSQMQNEDFTQILHCYQGRRKTAIFHKIINLFIYLLH